MQMLQPTRHSQIGLTGSQLFGSQQAKRARQPSGANAPQRQPGQEKLIGLSQPLSGMGSQPKPGKPLAAAYYQPTPLSQSAQPSQQTDYKALYGPVATQNQSRPQMSSSASNDPYGPHSGYTATPKPQLGEQDQDPVAKAQSYYDSTRQLARTNQPDYTDWNLKTDIQNRRVAENNASMDAMNQHQASGGGLKYQQASTGFGTSEQVAQSAANLNSLAAHEQGKRDAYNANQDALMNKHQADRDARRAQQELPTEQGGMGLRNAQQASADASSLTGQYQAIMKNGQAKGLKYLDFVQQKIDSGELDIGDDAVKVIEKSYGHEFSDMDKDRAGTYSAKWGNPLDRVYGVSSDRADARLARVDAGMANLRDMAAQQSRDRAYAAQLISQGMSTDAARAAVARHNQIQSYYETAIQREVLPAQLQAQADITRANAQAQADMYRADAQSQDLAAQRLHDERLAAIYGMPPAKTGSKATKKPTDAAIAPNGSNQPKGSGSQPKAQQSPKVLDAVSALTADKTFKKHQPDSLAVASSRLAEAGLSPAEHAEGLSMLYDADFSDSETSLGTISNIAKHAEKKSSEQRKWNDRDGVAQQRADAMIMEHLPSIKALAHASGLTPEQIAAAMYPDVQGWGIYDPWIPQRRKRLIDALSENDNPNDEE